VPWEAPLDATNQPIEEPKLTEAEQTAQRRMLDAVEELKRAAQGTSLAAMLPFQSLVVNLDSLVEVLIESGLVSRVEFFERVTQKFDGLTKECRRAVLSAGGASALAGLKPPRG